MKKLAKYSLQELKLLKEITEEERALEESVKEGFGVNHQEGYHVANGKEHKLAVLKQEITKEQRRRIKKLL